MERSRHLSTWSSTSGMVHEEIYRNEELRRDAR